MRAPSYILLALALLGLQACDIAAAQECSNGTINDALKEMAAAMTALSTSLDRVTKENTALRQENDSLRKKLGQKESEGATYAGAAQPQANTITRYGEDIYNRQFNANNVVEFDVDVEIVKKILAEYEVDVAPHREYSTDDICVVNPYKTVWKEQGGGVYRSNAVWYSPRNRETFEKYLNIVDEIGLEDIFRGTWIDSDNVSVLAMFFLTRDHSENLNMHLDWPHDVHTQILSVLIPLREVGIHFTWTDNDGKVNHYKYEVGKALGFGGGFLHSTDVGDSDLDDVIFNLYIAGSDIPDDPEDLWWHFLYGTDDEMQMYMHPSEGFVKHEWYDDDKDVCLEEATLS